MTARDYLLKNQYRGGLELLREAIADHRREAGEEDTEQLPVRHLRLVVADRRPQPADACRR